jgi:adenylosuccinate lyase
MLARTHGQPASPLGKEIGVLEEQMRIVQYPFCSQIWWSNRKLQCT